MIELVTSDRKVDSSSEGTLRPNLSDFLLPCPQEPPYVPTASPTEGDKEPSILGYSKNLLKVLCVAPTPVPPLTRRGGGELAIRGGRNSRHPPSPEMGGRNSRLERISEVMAGLTHLNLFNCISRRFPSSPRKGEKKQRLRSRQV